MSITDAIKVLNRRRSCLVYRILASNRDLSYDKAEVSAIDKAIAALEEQQARRINEVSPRSRIA